MPQLVLRSVRLDDIGIVELRREIFAHGGDIAGAKLLLLGQLLRRERLGL